MFISELAADAKELKPLELFAEAVQENDTYIIDLNTSQLSIGKDANDKPLYPYATDEYSQYKMALGSQSPYGTPNLYVTGEFYSGFTVKSDIEGLNITSTDSKTGKLIQMYDEDIFGLSSKSKSDLKSVLLPTYLKKIRDVLLRK